MGESSTRRRVIAQGRLHACETPTPTHYSVTRNSHRDRVCRTGPSHRAGAPMRAAISAWLSVEPAGSLVARTTSHGIQPARGYTMSVANVIHRHLDPGLVALGFAQRGVVRLFDRGWSCGHSVRVRAAHEIAGRPLYQIGGTTFFSMKVPLTYGERMEASRIGHARCSTDRQTRELRGALSDLSPPEAGGSRGM